jgi:hypothetical protein
VSFDRTNQKYLFEAPPRDFEYIEQPKSKKAQSVSRVFGIFGSAMAVMSGLYVGNLVSEVPAQTSLEELANGLSFDDGLANAESLIPASPTSTNPPKKVAHVSVATSSKRTLSVSKKNKSKISSKSALPTINFGNTTNATTTGGANYGNGTSATPGGGGAT